MNKKLITKIANLIELRPDFRVTLNQGIQKDEWLHSYHIVEHDKDKVIIMSEFDDTISYERQFLIYAIKKGLLRVAKESEDTKYRERDDDNPYRELDTTEFIIGREGDNKITRGDEMND